ncbi:MAG TPA: helix-turn-helix transcriptional regulator [Rubrivivax sp.]|nr:helix-turn-helix transcriptional regulator [Rubrivivax sp.]
MKPPSRSTPVADFASAAMLRVLAQGMRELGMDPGALAPSTSARNATVPLGDKRELLAAALRQGGIGCLALLGRGLHHYAHEPTHSALALAHDAADLFARWARLERYIHSRHRIELLALTEQHARIAHLSRPGFEPPLPTEDLVVLGVLVALLEAIGASAVSASIGDVEVYPQPDQPRLADAVNQHGTAVWSIAWTPASRSARLHRGHLAPAPELAAPQAWPEHAQRSFSTLCADLMNPKTLPALAHAQGEAPRTLQRNLSRAGLSYNELLGQARCSSASWWLTRTATPIAEVGFVSGYADQPHFTRDFRSRVGVTPLAYRSAFGTPDAACG